MRQIVLDTETTGLEPALGHRIIEIGCVEILDRRITSRRFHRYINPGRDIDAGAIEVHGLTLDSLRDKPPFAEVAMEFVEFIRGAELIIHNAPFDVGFLDSEFALLDLKPSCIADCCSVFDTLPLAREMHPGQRNSLDALCRRYAIDNAHRELHGALLDAELLAEVYLAMTGGQTTLALEAESAAERTRRRARHASAPAAAHRFAIVSPSAAELEAHQAALLRVAEASGGECLWLKDPA